MTSFRRNLITGDPIVFAPERAARPRAFLDSSSEGRCPFCRGHEADTPPEIARAGDPWRARVVPNKYPSIPGAEVIIEAPDHDSFFDAIDHADDVVRLYRDRYTAHADAAFVSIFKNEGVTGGSSMSHLHSQLVPMPFVPIRIEREVNAFERASECPLCAAIDRHRSEGLLIREAETLAWLAPEGSSMPYQQWIVPKRHVVDLAAFTEAEMTDLAMLLRYASAAMREVANGFNWLLMNFPRRGAAHFYVDLFPRLTTVAGFELGTGTFVEIIDPAATARRFR